MASAKRLRHTHRKEVPMARRKSEPAQGRVEITEGYQPTPDTIVFALFGKSMKSLVYDIRNNVDGKYDALYEEGEPNEI